MTARIRTTFEEAEEIDGSLRIYQVMRKPGLIRTLADFAPPGAEAGVGLALQDELGDYLFFLAGSRHHCPPGERFYAGIGGHREPGEDWLACARREAWEETGADVEILNASATWHLPHGEPVRPVEIADRPRPLAVYEMIQPPGTPRAGSLYRIVVYRARLCAPPTHLPPEEVQAVIALTAGQVVRGPDRKVTLARLQREGARIVATAGELDLATRVYPLGTAYALAQVLAHTESVRPPSPTSTAPTGHGQA